MQSRKFLADGASTRPLLKRSTRLCSSVATSDACTAREQTIRTPTCEDHWPWEAGLRCPGCHPPSLTLVPLRQLVHEPEVVALDVL